MSKEEDMTEEEESTPSCTLDGFTDSEEAKQLIRRLGLIRAGELGMDAAELEGDCDRFKAMVDKYQEQPHLLDPHLVWLLADLTALGMDKGAHSVLRHQAFKYLTLITKTRGYKIVVRQLPHEVSDMEPVLEFLVLQDPLDRNTWETRYMLLLWLSIVVIVPFHLSRFDTLEIDESLKKSLADRLLDITQSYLDKSDKTQNAAAYLISKFITRPDAKGTYLPQFLDWAVMTIKNIENICVTPPIVRGILTALGLLFKHGKRDDLLPHAKTVLQEIHKSKFMQSNDSQLRKLFIKTLQRIGLIFLKPRVASWRYQRGTRSLADNLSPKATDCVSETTDVDEDEDYDIPEEIEIIMEELINGLKDRDNIVRWSAAKGIGRVTGRLPKELADDIVESILEVFTLRENDDAWHGGCLALAELGRRGLLLPQRLGNVVPIILRALIYDVQRGNFSVGATIRDSACYVCWSFARAYDPVELIPYVNTLAVSLIIATIFDREVNCRRAAAAAFQENVGRQGTFPHGIDIITAADYFSVGSKGNCYLSLSMQIAQYQEYTKPLIDHLVEHKINHWDVVIRELSAKALHNLTSCALDHMITSVLPQLVKLVENIDLATRHGAVLALGEVVHAIALHASVSKQTMQDMLDPEFMSVIEYVIPTFQSRKMFRGIGGELMRHAVIILIEKLSLAKWPFSSNFGSTTEIKIDIYQKVLDESIAYNNAAIQLSAAVSLREFCSEYYRGNMSKVESMMKFYLEQLSASSETIRIGFAQALGMLPGFAVAPHIKEILAGLSNCCEIIQPDEKEWTELRKISIGSLATLCKNLGFQTGDHKDCISADDFSTISECCLKGMNDYTTTNRGDVGAVVREASMTALKEILQLATESDPSLVTPELSERFMTALSQQAQEKIDRTRGHAVDVFLSMLHSSPTTPFIPCHNELCELFPEELCKSLSSRSPGTTFPLFVQLLSFPEYTYSVLLGLTVSVGGNVESQVKYSSVSLFTFLKSIYDQKIELERIGKTLLDVFRNHQKVPRVSLPFMKMMSQSLTSGFLTQLIQNPNCDFAATLVDLLQIEVNKSKDLIKVMAAIAVYCSLLQSHEKVQRRALLQIAIYLCHPYPRVRKEAADQLYEALITYGNVICSDESVDEVSSLLSETLWDGSIDAVRPIRNKLCCLLNIPEPKLIKKNIS